MTPHATPHELPDEGTPEDRALPVPVSRARVPARANTETAWGAPGRNGSPVGDALRKRAEADPEKVAEALWEALHAERVTWQDGEGHVRPDHATRLRAAETILNRLEGLPVARTETSGPAGGGITLAMLLTDDPRDTISPPDEKVVGAS